MSERKCEGTLTPFNLDLMLKFKKTQFTLHHEYSPTPANSPQSILIMIDNIHTETPNP
ncbi:hypothetical protein BT69DRAFT_1280731 [Atractiella rhizophila]|nr:hypothetical protein BT69DRAFT_1280731 [Atractiella rhizophila]